MVTKKIQLIFAVITLLALFLLAYNWYNSYSFKNSALPQKYIDAINLQEQKVLANMQKNLGFYFKVPIIISDKIPGKIYGVTSQDKNKNIKIYLNKKVMKESFEYILSNVIAHEYAHAVLFKNGYYAKNNAQGHSEFWRQTCVKLGGKNCQKYVDSHDVIMNKLPF